MESNNNNSKNSVIVIGVLFLLSLIGNGVFFSKNNNLQSERDGIALRMDSVLSIKMLLDKEFDDAKNDLSAFKGKNAELDSAVQIANAELQEKKVKIEKLMRDNATVNSLKKQLAEFKNMRADLEGKIATLVKDKERLESENLALNKTNSTLKGENDALARKLETAKELKVDNIAVNNFKVKKNNKASETFKAKKINKMEFVFELEDNQVAEAGSKNVYLVISDPKGSVLSSQNNKFYNKKTKKESVYTTMKSVDYKNDNQKVSIDYDLNAKLTKGIYRAEIYTDGVYSGRTEFALK